MDNDNKETFKVDNDSSTVKTVKMNYPSNSYKDRNAKEPQKRVKKVVKGGVVKKKKSLGKRFLETFVADDVDSVVSYVLHDLLIPAAKSTITDLIQSLPELIFYGGTRGPRRTRDQGRTYVNYDKYSSGNKRDDRRDISYRNRARHNFDDIILETRGEAEEVLSNLVDLITDYHQATVADLYDLVDVTGSYTDDKYGWTDLRSASVSRVREGYMLNLPRPVLLD
jgi:hypothetical protein